MTDLNFAALNTAYGQTLFTVSGASVSIDLNKLMGESSISLTDEKIAEFLTRLLDLTSKAQIAYNANPANTRKIDSYPQSTSGVPVLDDTTGNFYVTSTYSFSSRAPLNKSETTAVVS